MKHIILSILSTAAIFGAIAPMANAMPNRLENLRQAHLNDVYLNPRQADITHQTLGQIQPSQQASYSRLTQLHQAHLDGIYLNPRQVDVANPVNQTDHGMSAQTQASPPSGSTLQQMHRDHLTNRY